MADKKLIGLNFSIIKHWQNWVIVLLMVIFAMLGVEVLLQYFNIQINNSTLNLNNLKKEL